MMTTKFTTKTYSSSPQESSLKPDQRKTTGAENTGVPEGKEFGEFLNEVADPNYVPPEKLRKVGNNQLDKDAFFKLMLAQVKYQDPTSPMKSDEMAAQLAQFTSLEQLQNLNTKMDELTKAQQPTTQYQALNFIGKSVATDTSRVIRNPGDKTHDLRFSLLKDAAKVEVTVKDITGGEVRKYEIANLKSGEQKFVWNGLDKANNPTRAGEYYFDVKATDMNEKPVAAQTSYKGVVTGVNYSAEGPLLMLGNQTIRLRDVQKIEDTELKSNQEKQTGLALQGDVNAKDDQIEGAKRSPVGNMDQVAMSYNVMDQNNQANQAKQSDPDRKATKGTRF